MTCNCINDVNQKLGDQYLKTAISFTGKPEKAIVDLMQRDKFKVETRKNKPKYMVANFCPFCGKEYDEVAT